MALDKDIEAYLSGASNEQKSELVGVLSEGARILADAGNPENYRHATELIKPEYRVEFIKFTQTGEANDTFMAYIDNDRDAQKAVDIVFKIQEQAFHEFAKMIHPEPKKRTFLDRVKDYLLKL